MKVLGIDIGSSSVKAAVLGRGMRVSRVAYTTKHTGPRVEVDANQLLAAIAKAVRELNARHIDVIVPCAMAPSWVAMDARGKAISPMVTHQDRRSTDEAKQIEQIVGARELLKITGNGPFPGGISSTTHRWFAHHTDVIRRADLVGHATTLLHRTWCGSRVTDPSNASFTGLYHTTKLAGWSEAICRALGVDQSLLPDVREGNEIAGQILPSIASAVGVPSGTPMLTGVMDGSAGMLATGASVGQLLNICGSTDVLALCCNVARPSETTLTRALGIDKKFLTVSTVAASGSAIAWARRELFSDYSDVQFRAVLTKLSRKPMLGDEAFCDPSFAGSRTSIDRTTASFANLTLASTRIDMLAGLLMGLVRASSDRLDQFQKLGLPIRSDVFITGGASKTLDAMLRRGWRPGLKLRRLPDEATLIGLAKLVR
jgi:xylulokinase